MNNVLIVFMSCKKNKHLWNNLLNIVPNSIVFYGDTDAFNDDDKTFLYNYTRRELKLNCQDTYDYLPVKVCLMISAILNIPSFDEYTHILKVDDHDTKIDKNINEKFNNITLTDFCGQLLNGINYGSRKWHFYKCPPNSLWYNKEYKGKYQPYLDGGAGYILSKKSMNIVYNELNDMYDVHHNFIFEDVMIAMILHKNRIFPTQINNIIEDSVIR